MKRLILAGLAVVAGAVIAAPAQAAPLPDNCTKVQGTVTCTTTDGPGKNQGGVGTVTETETQGNTTNKSPEESQDLEDSQTCRPPSSAVWGADCS